MDPSVSTSEVQQAPRSRPGLWAWIQDRINLALYSPRPAQGVVASQLNGREGIYYVLRSPDAGSYLKLAEEDYYLWTQMDGQRNVKDLVVAYFARFGAFAFDRVGQLVRELRRGGFLTDRPVEVLTHVQAELEERELVSRGQRLVSAFVHHEFLIPGIDGFLDRLYRVSFWLFSWPVQLLFLLVVLSGLALFIDALLIGEVPLLTVGGSYWLGLIALLGINAANILIHELAHGLTTKRFGRQVRRGGFLIYYGYPAFFVDTMDMWLESRWARIAVSWSGPHSGLIIGGLCALVARVVPESGLTPWLFKTAFVAYISVFINMNPLLELDGYFILIDWLDIPMLRQRAFGFIRFHFWSELRDVWRKWRQGQANWRAGYTREERLLTVFGLLAAAYTLYSVWVAVYFWQTRIIVALRELWHGPGLFSKLLLAAVVGVVVIPIGGAFLAQLVVWARRGVNWLRKRGYFESDRNVILACLVVWALLTLGPVLIYDPWWSRYLALMPLLLLCLAGITLVRTARRFQGSEFGRVFWFLTAAVGLLWLASLLRAPTHLRYLQTLAGAPLPSAEATQDPWLTGVGFSWVYSLERLAALPLVLAGFFGLARVDLRRGTLAERLVIAALIIAAGLVAISVARWMTDGSLVQALLSVSAPYLILIFLATVLPTLTAFASTRFFVPWLVLTVAALLTGAVGLLRALSNPPAPNSDLDRWLALAMAALWALGATLYDLTVQRLRFERVSWDENPVLSEEERLRQAFARFFAGLFDSYQGIFGNRRARAVDDHLDVMAVKADWDVEIDGGRVKDELDLSRITVWEQADRYREVLSHAVDLIDDWAGRLFVVRAARAAYDSLSWPEREVLGRYVLTGTDWGAAIAARFASHRGVRWRLVRTVPLFAHCSEQALNLITSALESQRVPAGTVIARQGAPMERFILIQSGEVGVWRRDEKTEVSRLVGELRRGASLGDHAFFGVGHYEATYRTSSSCEVLTLHRSTCDRLVRAGVALATRVGASLEVVRLFSGMPLFSHLSPQQLSALASHVRRRTTLGSQIVAHMGAERHSLYVVVEGEVEALADDDQGNKFVAQIITSGEHFGEYALFADTPYQFTYRTRGPAKLLTLDEDVFDALVAQSERMAGYVEQIGSGRLLTVQHRNE